MGVLHEVASATVAGGLSDALPVSVLLHLSADVADHGAEVSHTETRLGFVRGESLAGGEVVDALSLLGKSVARHSVESLLVLVVVESQMQHRSFLDSYVCIITCCGVLSSSFLDFFQELSCLVHGVPWERMSIVGTQSPMNVPSSALV
jgi:hypothetical protein